MTTQQTNDNEISYIIRTQISREYNKDSNEARCLGMASETNNPSRAMAQDACKSLSEYLILYEVALKDNLKKYQNPPSENTR